MNLCILSEFGLTPTHGSGAQIARLLKAGGVSFRHFYWSTNLFGRSTWGDSICLQNASYWPWQRGGGKLARFEERLGIAWWLGDEINGSRFRHLLASGSRFDAAYVFATSESGARRSLSLLRHLDCPYIVHIWDWTHQEGMAPESMPGLSRLLAGASSIFVLNEALRAEAARMMDAESEVIPFGQAEFALPKDARDQLSSRQVIMAGNLHTGSFEVLEKGWKAFGAQRGDVRLAYVGSAFDSIPQQLRGMIHNYGFVSDDRYREILLESHVALLTGPCELDCYGRFSIPSRIADFYMAGLPIVARVAPGSAAEAFLSPMEGTCVRIVNEKGALASGLSSWLDDAEAWQRASVAARTFAVEHLSIGRIWEKIERRFQEAVSNREPPLLVPRLAGNS